MKKHPANTAKSPSVASHLRRIPTAILIVVGVLAVVFVVAAAKASAQNETTVDWRSVRQKQWICRDWNGCGWEYRWRRVRTYRPPVYAYERRREHVREHAEDDRHRDRSDDRAMCLDTIVNVLSTEHTQEDNAREAARKLWMATSQWKHGGQYMAIENAKDVLWRCSASNAHDTISGKIAESIGKLTGREGQNVRCALWARPCKAQREKDRDLRR